MTPSNVILDRLAELLAEDTTTLAPAALAVHVHLVQNAFTPSRNLVIADFTLADFDGGDPLDADVGPQQDFYDPVTGRQMVQLVEPAGGWHWITTGTTNLPQDIYGFVVTDNADAVVFGCERFETPVALSAVGQAVDIPYIRFAFVPLVLA